MRGVIRMKKIIVINLLLISLFSLTGCKKDEEKILAENIKKMHLTGNLVTYQAYYHNVVEYDKKAGTGITHLFEEDRKLFAEYTGTIKLGINLSNVKVSVLGREINVFIPKASVIGSPNVDKDDFKEENFIESREGINKNPITADDSAIAFDKAQAEMLESASRDEELLAKAQQRAKIIIEENIIQFSGLNQKDYSIDWEYEQ